MTTSDARKRLAEKAEAENARLRATLAHVRTEHERTRRELAGLRERAEAWTRDLNLPDWLRTHARALLDTPPATDAEPCCEHPKCPGGSICCCQPLTGALHPSEGGGTDE